MFGAGCPSATLPSFFSSAPAPATRPSASRLSAIHRIGVSSLVNEVRSEAMHSFSAPRRRAASASQRPALAVLLVQERVRRRLARPQLLGVPAEALARAVRH